MTWPDIEALALRYRVHLDSVRLWLCRHGCVWSTDASAIELEAAAQWIRETGRPAKGRAT